jgi:hypothetical protein
MILRRSSKSRAVNGPTIYPLFNRYRGRQSSPEYTGQLEIVEQQRDKHQVSLFTPSVAQVPRNAPWSILHSWLFGVHPLTWAGVLLLSSTKSKLWKAVPAVWPGCSSLGCWITDSPRVQWALDSNGDHFHEQPFDDHSSFQFCSDRPAATTYRPPV